ncbi:14256_t:CDS:2 [Funneliformis geosporum]|uniref:14256_t:CDS:1 n=1 Tax=Funneliformis geosporum TaxID=1117311 RepID=A0A9W4SB89_9GLOM|nr:14256_t:CDS:2 [Funneliformis geosporum]
MLLFQKYLIKFIDCIRENSVVFDDPIEDTKLLAHALPYQPYGLFTCGISNIDGSLEDIMHATLRDDANSGNKSFTKDLAKMATKNPLLKRILSLLPSQHLIIYYHVRRDQYLALYKELFQSVEQ